MTYCVSDIHNDYDNFVKLLSVVDFDPEEDRLYIVGDIFDRGMKPIELYEFIRKKGDSIIPLLGNHDLWLADFIRDYRDGLRGDYFYNTFEIIKKQMGNSELNELEGWIRKMPLFKEIEVNGEKIMLSHAQTFEKPEEMSDRDILLGRNIDVSYLMNGISGYVSVIGHTGTDMIRKCVGEPMVVANEIWINPKGNLFAIDCGNGFRHYKNAIGMRLGIICLETKEVYYV